MRSFACMFKGWDGKGLVLRDLLVFKHYYKIRHLLILNLFHEDGSSRMKTYNATKETAQHNWYMVDAAGKTLGRLASEVAKRLRGKHKPEYTPHVDTGDYIIVINASQVKVTGKKNTDKVYYSHSGYPGGVKAITFEQLLQKHPERVIEKAVKNMLPKNPLGRAMYRKLKVYAGTEHPHGAQQPQVLDFETEE